VYFYSTAARAGDEYRSWVDTFPDQFVISASNKPSVTLAAIYTGQPVLAGTPS